MPEKCKKKKLPEWYFLQDWDEDIQYNLGEKLSFINEIVSDLHLFDIPISSVLHDTFTAIGRTTEDRQFLRMFNAMAGMELRNHLMCMLDKEGGDL